MEEYLRKPKRSSGTTSSTKSAKANCRDRPDKKTRIYGKDMIFLLAIFVIACNICSEEALLFQSDAVSLSSTEFFIAGTQFGGIDETADIIHFAAPLYPDEVIPLKQNDTTPPEINFFQTPTSASPESGFNTSFTVTDNSGTIKCVTFNYRYGGEAQIRTDTLQANGGIYSKSILPLQFSLRGFSWVIEAIDTSGNRRIHASDSNSSTSGVIVSRGITFSREAGGSIPSDSWRFFSLPFLPSEKRAGLLLQAFLGQHDSRNWKMVVWNGLKYVSLSDSAIDFNPGQSYYIYSRGKNNVDFESGSLRTTPTGSHYPIRLRESGWTHIAVPFAFPVKWKDFFRSSTERTSWNLEGPLPDPIPQNYTGIIDSETVLHPWGGYWIYNANSYPCTLYVSPIAAGARAKTTSATGNQRIFTITNNNGKAVIFGQKGTNSHSIPLPPSPDNSSQLYIPGNKLSRSLARFTSYTEETVLVDSFVISSTATDYIEISITITGSHPERCYLWNKATGGIVLISSENFSTSIKHGTWLLIAGSGNMTDSIIAALNKEAPYDFQTSTPSPNPFNPSTKIKVGLPFSETTYEININIFSSSGKVVNSTNYKNLSAGWHEIYLDGKDNSNRELSAGLYLCRISVSGNNVRWNSTMRLALIK
jgi:hypothetical protein